MTTSPTREKEISQVVGARVAALQRDLEFGTTAAHSASRGELARLRRLRPADLGANTASWALTLEVLPPALLGRGDAPTATEKATQTALMLFATHAQSARSAMHAPGQNLGRAIRALADRRDADDPMDGPVMARFQSMAKAQTYEHLVAQLRGLVQLLRGEGIQLDYGSLAADLFRAQQPGGMSVVRLRWGRGFHRTPITTSEPTPASSPIHSAADESETSDVH